MIVCPVCEHSQAEGFECEVCGKDLGGFLSTLGPPPVATERVEGLEATPEKLGEVPVERMADLDPAAFAKVGDVGKDVVPELEATLIQTGDVAVEAMADKEVDRAVDDGVRTAAPTGVVACRYCGNKQAEGALCDRCGMRLNRVADPGVVKGVAVEEWIRCASCGAPAVAGQRCKECGKLSSPPEG